MCAENDFSFFTVEYDVSGCAICISEHVGSRLPLCPFPGSIFFFTIIIVKICIKTFYIYWMVPYSSLSRLLIVYLTVDVEISLHPWDTPTWLCCMMFLTCCSGLIAGIYWRFCKYCVHLWYWAPFFLFWWYLCLVLLSGNRWCSQETDPE